MRILVFALLTILATGCGKPYTENQRLNYLDQADKIAKGHSFQVEMLGLHSPEQASEKANELKALFEEFKAKHQGKEIDKDLGGVALLEKLNKAGLSYSVYFTEKSYLQAVQDEGNQLKPEDLASLEEAKKTEVDYKAALEETKAALEKARKGE